MPATGSRRAGVTIRKTLDCLIAAPRVRTSAPLLHADHDFDRPAKLCAVSDLGELTGFWAQKSHRHHADQIPKTGEVVRIAAVEV